MRLRILGCSGGIGAGRRTTSYLIDERILLDCGTGVGDLQLEEMCGIRHVFLTHSHLDHVAALPLFVKTVFSCLPEKLIVHGQQVTLEAIQEHLLNWTIWPDFAELPNKDKPVMGYAPLVAGEPVEVSGYTFEAIPVDHPVPAVAYRVSKDGRAFCFSGDSGPNDTLWASLNAHDALDLLLIECGFPNAQEELAGLAKHYTPKSLALDLAKLDHTPRIAVTHLHPGAEEVTWAECQEAIRGRDLVRVAQGDVLTI